VGMGRGGDADSPHRRAPGRHRRRGTPPADDPLHLSVQRTRLARARAALRACRGRPPSLCAARRSSRRRRPRACRRAPPTRLAGPRTRIVRTFGLGRRDKQSSSASLRRRQVGAVAGVPRPRDSRVHAAAENLRGMPLVRTVALAFAVLALAGGANARVRAPTKVERAEIAAPRSLHAFLPGLASGSTSFPRTPAFAWNPVRGAAKYELVLATDPVFSGNSIAWDDPTVTSPVAAIPISLPWITGTPHSLYARVRGIATNGAVGPWSKSFGFDMRWMDDGIPVALDSPPGLVRWQPVDGATAYQVWFQNVD